jgi:hypothetical protein
VLYIAKHVTALPAILTNCDVRFVRKSWALAVGINSKSMSYIDTILSGWNSNPIARRVVDLDSCYYILARRLKCRHGCQKSCNPYDDKILAQLPPHISR